MRRAQPHTDCDLGHATHLACPMEHIRTCGLTWAFVRFDPFGPAARPAVKIRSRLGLGVDGSCSDWARSGAAPELPHRRRKALGDRIVAFAPGSCRAVWVESRAVEADLLRPQARASSHEQPRFRHREPLRSRSHRQAHFGTSEGRARRCPCDRLERKDRHGYGLRRPAHQEREDTIEELTVRVIPRQANEFTCSPCFSVPATQSVGASARRPARVRRLRVSHARRAVQVTDGHLHCSWNQNPWPPMSVCVDECVSIAACAA